MSSAAVVGTWAFSKGPVKTAGALTDSREMCVDCVEKALNEAEEDESFGSYFVGRGGKRNVKGELQLDAAIMRGSDLGFGAVTALQGVPHASSVARLVMERSRHSMLTGQGAQDFAVQHGFSLDPKLTQIMSEEVSPSDISSQQQHDTLGLIVLDKKGSISAGVTTSGMAGKARGRVGDSALPGSGLYADNEAGAACCSGDGDQIMKFCPSFHVVQLLKQGMGPEVACQTVVKSIIQRLGKTPVFELAIIAMDVKGRIGAASTVEKWVDIRTGETYLGFPYAVWTQGKPHEPCMLVAPPTL